jgi:ribosomal protein L11 methyltransferase
MAFGTGSHATTALCLERCDELLAELPGADVLDVGTGSGVIALLAKKLGARRVVGTDNDPVALAAAREGEALNGVSGVEWVLAGDPASVPGEFGIVIANILLNTLEELAPAIASKVAPAGRLVLSGLLAAQADAAERAYVAQGLLPAARKERDGWVRVELSRP